MICRNCSSLPAEPSSELCRRCSRELAAQFTDLLHGPAIVLNPSDIVRLEAQQESAIEEARRTRG